MKRREILSACLVVLALTATASCCLGTPDGALPEAVTFRTEAVHTGGTPDEVVFRYYPDTAEPSSYLVTFEIRQGGQTAVAVAGRVFEGISADNPIELPPVPAEPGVTVTARTKIIDRYGRSVHSSESAVTPGGAQTTG